MSWLGSLVRQVRREPALPAPPDPGFFELDAGESEIVKLRMRRPIIAGSLVVLFMVVGLFVWAVVSPVAGAVIAPATVKVENNSKLIRHAQGGIVRHIYVHEGQRVRANEPLITLDPVQVQSSVDMWQAQYDSALADTARWQAQLANAPDIRFPAELTARQSDPRVAALIAGERGLFLTSATLYRSQASVLRGQQQQIQTQIQGLRAQMASAEAQSSTIVDELSGVQELNRLGYAPKTRVLGLQRSSAQLKGQRGSILADIARAQQAIGDLRIQIAQLDDKRETEAAEGLRQAQDKLTDAEPKLRASSQQLTATVIRSPVDGFVFNLTQYTEGGFAQAGERLMEIVPANTPMVITARVKPSDIASVHTGMRSRVTLTAYNPRTTPPVDGTVTLVSADATTDEQSPAALREPFYLVQIKVDAAELARVGKNVHLTPGMPAQVSIITGSRTIMDYLLGPLTNAMHGAMHER